MKISSNWVREFVDVKVDDQQLARDLSSHGIGVEGLSATPDGGIVFEVEFTANRPDTMNHYGVARECSAIYDLELKPLAVKLPEMAMAAGAGSDFDPRPDKKEPASKQFSIEIEDPQGCARYTARVIRGVRIGESRELIVRRLQSVEQRPINNAADASNYTLWEMGHPTHAFDLDLLEGGRIVVRRAHAGETLRTLDGIDRKLSPEDLVIADAGKPVGLAGVMGGEATMITAKTRNVLIESAWFDPVAVRKTAKRHSLHTDASHRFERGADFAATPLACARVAQLILESAGGKLEAGAIDVIARSVTPPEILLRQKEVRRILGKAIAEAEVERILLRLGFGVMRSTSDRFSVQPPAWRLDVEREIDVIEEIARIHGYDDFPGTLPGFAGAVVELPDEGKDAKLRQILLAMGYGEALSWTFVGAEDAKTFSSAQPLALENPISDEATVMRTSLLPGMMQMLAWNLNRGNHDVRLFEAGHIFSKQGERADERKRLCIGATGNVNASHWGQPARPYSFFDMKGTIEQVLGAFDCRALYFDRHAAEWSHPGRSARAVVDGTTVAYLGQLHPKIAAERKLRQDVHACEIYLDRLFEHALRKPHYVPVSRFPAVERDYSLVFADEVTFEQILGSMSALQIADLQSIVPAEVFRGGGVPAGKYSVLLRARFQSSQRTLTEEDVALWSQQIIAALEALGGTLRKT
ncbi:MAG: phenylalanine--tRNA ligase subunit beta [Terriglobales bacterium]|jgi:phenylalanyl-tRNA synthetase beta chain